MAWLGDFIYGLHVDRRAIAERDKYRTIVQMAVTGFRILVAKRLKTAHGVKLRTIISYKNRPVDVWIEFNDLDILRALQQVNEGTYKSIKEAVRETAEELWTIWNSRFDQQPDFMRRYKKHRGHPAQD
jgi:hypothetical protein